MTIYTWLHLRFQILHIWYFNIGNSNVVWVTSDVSQNLKHLEPHDLCHQPPQVPCPDRQEVPMAAVLLHAWGGTELRTKENWPKQDCQPNWGSSLSIKTMQVNVQVFYNEMFLVKRMRDDCKKTNFFNINNTYMSCTCHVIMTKSNKCLHCTTVIYTLI